MNQSHSGPHLSKSKTLRHRSGTITLHATSVYGLPRQGNARSRYFHFFPKDVTAIFTVNSMSINLKCLFDVSASSQGIAISQDEPCCVAQQAPAFGRLSWLPSALPFWDTPRG